MDTSGRVALPTAFEDSDIDNLALLIADMLERLMAHNDQIPLLPESLTRFHSRAIPSITVLDYLRRIIKFTKVEKSCLLLVLHYVDQICSRTPLFTLSSLTCHRFIIASITVSSKGLCDTFCTNSLYARVGGIPVSELNVLEREFLRMIDWRLTCTREVLQEYYVNLVRTDSTGQFYIHGMPETFDSSQSVEPSSSSATSDSGTDSMVTSPSSSPSPTPSHAPALIGIPISTHTHPYTHPHAHAHPQLPAPGPMSGISRLAYSREASTILIETATLTPQVSQGPTLEQNMAFADLQKAWAEQGGGGGRNMRAP